MPNELPAWEVTLNVFGPITVDRNINFRQRKEIYFHDRLYSNIEVAKNGKMGVAITLTAFSNEQHLARKAGLYFCGQALDVLSFETDLPLILSLTDNKYFTPRTETERRVTTEEEWVNAFKNARLWLLTEPTFLRALGWYRKGLYTEDPFDKFLAFYNSIEVLSSKYNPNKEACGGRASKCHMWETFKAVWGECNQWPVIKNQQDWIDRNYETRKDIAHGIASIDIHVVEEILEKLDVIKQVSHRLLNDWKREKLQPEVTPEIAQKLF